MKTYKFSIIISILAAVFYYFRSKMELTILTWTGGNFAVYIIYGLFLAFFLVLLFRVFSKTNLEIGVFLLILGMTGSLIFVAPNLMTKLTMLVLFIVGLIPALEGKKARSVVPFLIMLIAVVLVEVASNLRKGDLLLFETFAIWGNAIWVLSGYVSGCLLLK